VGARSIVVAVIGGGVCRAWVITFRAPTRAFCRIFRVFSIVGAR
jgi:hypothetical protein